MTTTAEHCIAAIGLNAYRHGRSCHNLFILPLLAHRYVSQGGSCSVKHIVVLHLTVAGCTSPITARLLHICLVYCLKTTNMPLPRFERTLTGYNDDWLWQSGSNVSS